MLPAEHFRLLRSLLACWTRCRALAAGLPLGGWGPRPENDTGNSCGMPCGVLVPTAGLCWIRMTPSLAERILGTGTAGSGAGKRSGRNRPQNCCNCLAQDVTGRRQAPKKATDLPAASIYCEDGAIAVMRRNWNRDDERIAVLFAGRRASLSWSLPARSPHAGHGDLRLPNRASSSCPYPIGNRLAGIPTKTSTIWNWRSSSRPGVKLQRQIVLAREDRFLLLADALMSPQHGGLEYRSVLPLPPQIEFRGAEESREGLLIQGRAAAARSVAFQAASRPLAQVLPLGMPEWRAQPHAGELAATAQGLELRQTAASPRLFAPLLSTSTAAGSAAA